LIFQLEKFDERVEKQSSIIINLYNIKFVNARAFMGIVTKNKKFDKIDRKAF